MFKVMDGKDPYTEIGEYIRNHITAIEDIIATIEIDGIRTNQLFMVDMQEGGYFVWESDWYEGERNIALIDFFPVSNAQPEQKRGRWIDDNCSECGQYVYHGDARNYCPNCGAKMEVEHEG